MLSRARFTIVYVLFWVLFFECARVLFLIYEWRHTASLGARLVAGTLLQGLPMDLSTASAIAVIPAAIIARDGFLPHPLIRRLLGFYSVVALVVSALIIVADLEMFKVWGFHIDAPVLRYLANPSEAFASASGSPLLLLVPLLAAVVVTGAAVMFAVPLRLAEDLPRVNQLRSFSFLVVALSSLVIAAQGGFRWRVPLTVSSVFFSTDSFANRAAMNPVWNLFISAAHLADESKVQTFTSPAAAQKLVDSLLKQTPGDKPGLSRRLLVRRPTRIIMIVWEGFTSKIAEPLGGLRGVTPGFSKLARDGVLFDGPYASGSRTTSGLVALLSGFPSHPLTNPLGSAPRSASLPPLTKALASAGYQSAFYYGGPLEFDNRRRYLLSAQFDKIVEKKDFAPEYWGSPWGVHDPYTLARVFRAVDTTRVPLFTFTLTLSSHEPFRTPPPVFIKGSTSEKRFLNTQAYTDKAVSNFVERLKTTRWWDSTLVIIVADHGSPYPFTGPALASASEQYRIPMLWVGGSLAVRDTIVRGIFSQFDIPRMLLDQLGVESTQFKWSKDILLPGTRPFAYYSINNGFGFVDGTGSYVFDNEAGSIVHRAGNPTPGAVAAGRAFQQATTQEYVDLSRIVRR